MSGYVPLSAEVFEENCRAAARNLASLVTSRNRAKDLDEIVQLLVRRIELVLKGIDALERLIQNGGEMRGSDHGCLSELSRSCAVQAWLDLVDARDGLLDSISHAKEYDG